jgi:hypothetical protein
MLVYMLVATQSCQLHTTVSKYLTDQEKLMASVHGAAGSLSGTIIQLKKNLPPTFLLVWRTDSLLGTCTMLSTCCVLPSYVLTFLVK